MLGANIIIWKFGRTPIIITEIIWSKKTWVFYDLLESIYCEKSNNRGWYAYILHAADWAIQIIKLQPSSDQHEKRLILHLKHEECINICLKGAIDSTEKSNSLWINHIIRYASYMVFVEFLKMF